MIRKLKEKRGGDMPSGIFEVPGIGLLALGSIACIRTIYFQAWKMRCLDRFAYVQMNEADYALGNTEKIRDMLNEMIQRDHIRGIIVYTSCVERILSLDLQEVLAEIVNPDSKPIEIFYRGPMVKRLMNPKENLSCILERMKDKGGKTVCKKTDRDYLPMPLLAPDFAAVMSLLENFPAGKLLITPGGCGNCLKSETTHYQEENIYVTEFDDLQLNAGCEQEIISRAPVCCQRWGFLCYMQSAVPYLTGQNWEEVSFASEKNNMESLWLGGSGFETGPVGAARALKYLGNRWSRNHKLKKGGRNIILLGKYRAGTPKSRYYQWIESELHKAGYTCVELGDIWNVSEDTEAAYLWAMSAEALPLARSWESEYKIPLLKEQQWDFDFKGKQTDSKMPWKLLTEPLLGIRLKNFLERQGLSASVYAYVPDRKTKKFYQEHLPDQITYFEDSHSLYELDSGSGEWVCDPIFRTYRKEDPEKKWHPLVYPMASGGLFD
ncbi:MAG TPA: nitrogenase component 1 [Candidatus Ruminococcus avistercoris]|nr:nitrogenase component 1 [Candidatus Ruminococcus avistercoris]